VFKNFCIDFFSGKLWKWLTGSLGAAVALFFIGKNGFGLSVFKSILLGICLLAIVFITNFIYYLFTNIHRKNAYAEAIVFLKEGFAGINKLKRENSNDSEEIMRTMVALCNNIKSVFDKLTKVDCSVSIKIPKINQPISGDAVVENICRDFNHYLVRNTDAYKKQEHRVSGNTAYQVILNSVLNGDRSRFFYLNNNVPKTKDYQTTSRAAYPNGVLPYKSELVYPILPIHPPQVDATQNSKPKYEIWGFLCIDCNDVNKFNERYHVPLIEGVADGVFDVIMRINKSGSKT
jgi:hypothetical protein